jgi:ribonuclease P protein component
MNKPFSLSKLERIKSKKTIETLFQQGEAFFSYPYRIVFSVTQNAETPALCFAISVPKRFFKRAHDRNRIKRQTREAYRLQKQTLQANVQSHQQILNVMMIYQAREPMDSTSMHKHIHQCLEQLQKRIYPNPTL